MSNTKVVLNSAGFRELLHSAELTDYLQSISSGIASRAGDGYSSDTYNAGTRMIASAYTESMEAIKECAQDGGMKLLGAMQA